VLAALSVLFAFLLQPITHRAWSPVMLPVIAVSTWYGGWPAALLAWSLGLAGRFAVVRPSPLLDPAWTLAWFTAHAGVVAIVTAMRRVRQEQAEARQIQREQAVRAQRATAARRTAFLAHASEVLASSPDYETTLAALADLAVPQIADLCIVDVLQDDGTFQCLAVAHADHDKVALVRELRRMFPLDAGAPYGPPRVLRSGRAVVYTGLDESLLIREIGGDGSQLRVATALGLQSAMAVPLQVGGRRLGVISFGTTSGRRFVPQDREFAEDVARRAAIAIDAARP
jgi:transcriptional regulator with GAF, ATPase, and Fis domain